MLFQFLFKFSNSLIPLYRTVPLPSPIQALEAQEQEKDHLRLPQQNPSPLPGNRRSGSPRSDRTPTPEPQSSPSPAASSPDLTTTNTTSSTPPPSAPDQDQAEDTPSINGEPEGGNAPVNGGPEPVTPCRGGCQLGPPAHFKFEVPIHLKLENLFVWFFFSGLSSFHTIVSWIFMTLWFLYIRFSFWRWWCGDTSHSSSASCGWEQTKSSRARGNWRRGGRASADTDAWWNRWGPACQSCFCFIFSLFFMLFCLFFWFDKS